VSLQPGATATQLVFADGVVLSSQIASERIVGNPQLKCCGGIVASRKQSSTQERQNPPASGDSVRGSILSVLRLVMDNFIVRLRHVMGKSLSSVGFLFIDLRSQRSLSVRV
jgi:hypothetical protein